jgi:hypothetical protein
MFKLDNTNKQIPLNVLHVAAPKDRYFNNGRVEEHLRRIFNEVDIFHIKGTSHAPTIIATAKEAAPLIPPGLRRKFNQKIKV